MSNFYLTTPIYYVNGEPHIGHAYTTIAADVVARYHRLAKDDVFFATGTDEHGQKIEKAAKERGVTPQALTDEVSSVFLKLWDALDIEYTSFIRTTDSSHVEKVKEFLDKLYQKGDIYLGEYAGWYCVPCESFFPEKQLEDKKCPDCSRDVESLKETCYFFRLSAYQDWLIEWIKSNKEGWISPVSRENEVLGLLKEPLEDLCISRPKERLTWGVELPFDPQHVTYVWFDALINYYSVLCRDNQEKVFWPCDAHLIGKDILRPHAIFWPIILHAMGLELPKKLVVHGWWTVQGEKMSKSKGNILDPYEIVEEYGLDAFRYFLLREIPFGSDGVFTKEQLIQRVNTELGNDFGNFISRTLGMLDKYCQGNVPVFLKNKTDLEEKMDAIYEAVCIKVNENMKDFAFSLALESIMEYVRSMNSYIENVSPWKLAKDPKAKARLDDVMSYLLQAIIRMVRFMEPFIPKTVNRVKAHLKVTDSEYEGHVLEEGKNIDKSLILFPRIEK
ncbi:methionine--tRNA ligase [PVC group bacterium (ex Bugula neritina AB1)]|nr:methionine--tRNA ligase [PVC group bacterium (ex Bugula neritina AB1)]